MEKILEVSKLKTLKGENIQHYSEEINNLYRPCGNNQCKQDGYNIVFSGDSNINQTKFFPILVKEWFYLVEKDGYLVIRYKPNNILNTLELEDELWTQWKGKYDLLAHKINDFQGKSEYDLVKYVKTTEINYNSLDDIGFDNFKDKKLLNQEWILILKKTKPTIIEGDSINKWTFGVITNGKRNDWIEELINSVKNQNIPEYEIIICGNYEVNRIEHNFKYIPFNKRNDLGWITKKKNLIIQNSSYENICILHDRYVFDKGWFEGMKKWGNNFEHITIRQLHINNMQKSVEIMDIMNPSIISSAFLRTKKLFFYSKIDDLDFSTSHYIGGGIHIGKKNILNTTYFNDTLFWQEGEDVDISINLDKTGYYARINPFSTVVTFRYHTDEGKFFNIPTDFKKEYNTQKNKYKIHSYYMYFIVYLSELSYRNIFIRGVYNFLKYLHKKTGINKII